MPLQENILTVPNLLSLSRIALSPVLGYLVLMENYSLAFGLLALAGVTDLVRYTTVQFTCTVHGSNHLRYFTCIYNNSYTS